MDTKVSDVKKSDKKEEKKVVVPKTLADVQRMKLEKLLKNPDKPVFIPEKRDPKLPRVFNPPEFVRNIWGSSAGAGSGDFHVYRGVRRREYARQKFLDQKSKKDELDQEFEQRLTAHKQEAVERTNKKRAKRLKKKQKAKEAKKRKTNKKSDVSEDKASDSDDDEDESASEDDDRRKKDLNGDEDGNNANSVSNDCCVKQNSDGDSYSRDDDRSDSSNSS